MRTIKGLEKHPFIDLPYDIFLEIARYLYPLDLIHLSRVNKLYRRVFMHRSSAGFWRAALINAGLPQCPDESFPEPKYATLIFLEQCTECQEPTDLHPDPIFLVRFCSRCQENKTMTSNTMEEALRFLIPRSEYFEAPLEWSRPYFHLREHYEEIAKKIRQLEQSGDTTLLEAYKAKRAEFVWTWYQKTVPLVEWTVKQRAEYQAKLNIRKEARQAEIEGRLLKLGLELIDIRDCRHWCPQWASLVDMTKPFDEKDWIKMLPSLINSVEWARKERLRKEAERYRSDRKRIIKNWLTLLSGQLQHMNIIITLRWKEPASNSADASCAPLYPPATKRWDQSIRIHSLPSIHYMMSNWPQLKNILGQPAPPNLETFREDFENKKRHFMEELSSWRPNLETALAKTLPMGTTPIEVQNSEFDLKAFINDGSMTEANTRLSRNLRCLLRADAVFKHKDVSKSVYYPDGFIGWTIDELMPAYDIESSRVAIAILNELRRPNASYLEMQAHGRSFLCARCANDSSYLSWEGIVDHYVHEHKQRQEDSGQDATCSEKGHHLVFTHDLNDGKSLICLSFEDKNCRFSTN